MIGKFRAYHLILSLFLSSGLAVAQVCSIDLGLDATICQGETHTFTAPAGFPNYLWSTGSTATSITVGTAGPYWGEASFPTGELATNGDFSGGNTGFSTQFNYNNTLTTDGNYWIGTNAASYHPQFFGTGHGAFLIVNAGWQHAGWDAWCNTITVCPEQTYRLSVRAMSLASQGPPLLDWAVDGVQQGLWMQTGSQGSWTTFTNTWTSAPGQTSANFCVRVASGHGIGNDFGLDEISISSTIVLRDEVELLVTPLPVVDLGPDTTLCAGQDLVLDAAVPGGTYVWQDGSTASSFLVSGAGTYSVTVTANDCSASDAITVAYTPLPVVDLGADQVLCAGENFLLNAQVPGGTYVWQNGSPAPFFNVTTGGTYSVSVTANNCTASDAVDFTFNPLPVVDLGADQTVCADVPILLDATVAGATYLWQDGSTGATFSPIVSGPYSVTVTLNECEASDATNISFTPLPVVDLGPDQIVCAGTAVLLDATVAGGTYLWQDGSSNPTFSPTTTGTYSVTVTANGCSASDAVGITVNPLPVVDLGADQTVCADVPVLLDATVAGATYLWQDGSTGATFSPTVSGPYSVTVTLNDCEASDATNISFTPLPVVDLGPDQTVCPGDVVMLDALVAGATYLWQDGSTAATFNATVPGNYSVQVTRNGCSDSDSFTLSHFGLQTVDLGPDVMLCQGQSILLDALLPGASYLWSTGASTSAINVTTAGPIWVQVTQGTCSASDTVLVTVNPMPAVDLGIDQTLCAGEDVLLDATSLGATYLWSTGAVTPTITASTTATYSVDVSLNGCTASDAITVTVLGANAVNLGADVVACAGEPILLDATTPGSTYLWSNGATSSTLSPTVSGTYWVRVSTGLCSASDTVIVTVKPMPAVDLGIDQTLCAGENVLLNATSLGATYLWSTGAVTPTITASTTATYSVDVSLNGCTASDAITVTVLGANAVNLGADVVACAGEPILLDATTPGSTYLWSNGATSATLSPTVSGTYWVRVSTGLCSASDTVLVTVKPMPAVDLGIDQTLCAGEDVLLDATSLGATYLWSTGAVTPTITASTTATYSVDVSLNGCTASDAITVTVLGANAVNLGADVVACAGEPILLDATTPGSTYLWSNGATSATLSPIASGTYWVRVSTGLCSASDTVMVTVKPMPIVDLGPAITLCGGETSPTLDAAFTGATYLWNTGASDASVTVITGGTYSVDVELNGCVTSDEVTVTFGSLAIDLGADTTLCPGETLTLTAGAYSGTAVWNDVETTPTYTVNAAGTYWVVISGSAGCNASDSITVAYVQTGVLDLGPDLDLCEGEVHELDATLVGASIVWENGSSNALRTVSSSGIYSVEATVGQCVLTDDVLITFNPLPIVGLGPDQAICPHSSAVFDATAPEATYLWHDGATNPVYAATSAGTVSVVVTVNGCSASDAAEVSMLYGPTPQLGNDTLICEGNALLLDVAEADATYLWDDGSVGPNRNVSDADSYWVQVTNNGCAGSDTIVVDVFTQDSWSLGADLTICSGASALLDASFNGADYAWSNGASTPSISVGSTGNYSVEISVAGCTAQDVIHVEVVQTPAPDLGPDISICEQHSVELSTVNEGGTLLWSTGETGSSIMVHEAGTYMVVRDSLGCTASDAITVFVQPLITEMDLGPDRTLCAGAFDVIQAELIPGATYLWNTGATGDLLAIQAPGEYTVTATGTCIEAIATVVVRPGDCGTYVYVPNTFTPNDDGFNDVFLPAVDGPVDIYQLDIYDRWGERIMTTTDRNTGWDGTYSGVPSQDGVYTWEVYYRVLALEGVRAERLTGHVTLLR